MFKIKKNKDKNRLYITISGIVSIAEAKSAKEKLEKEVDELHQDFDLVNDISRFIRGQEEAGAILQDIMTMLIQKKVHRIVRVVGDSRTGLLQFANFSLPLESYKLRYVPTLAEAEKFLDEN